MAGEILSPIAVWGYFKVEETPKAKEISKKDRYGISYAELYVEGEKVGEETTQIYGKYIRQKGEEKKSAVILIKDFEDNGEGNLATLLVKAGYAVFIIDLEGNTGRNEKFTLYPEELSYANYDKEKLYDIESNVKSTCWVVWAKSVRYVLKYLKSRADVKRVGAIGIGEAGTILWQVSAMDENLDASCFLHNAGWNAYRGYDKFSGQDKDIDFSDREMQILAGIEPQSYANKLKCPSITFIATNNFKFSADRAGDTVSRIPDQVYSCLDYSVGDLYNLDNSCYKNLIAFLEEFLNGKRRKTALPSSFKVESEIKGGKIFVRGKVNENELDRVELFYSEEQTNPALRCWIKSTEKGKDGKAYVFEVSPCNRSKKCFFFLKAFYKSGFSSSSNIFCVNFEEKDIKNDNRENLIYSSRREELKWVFVDAGDKTDEGIDLLKEHGITVSSGPLGFHGITSKDGIISFKAFCKKYVFNEDAILMLDIYSKEDSVAEISLICDYLGDRKEYTARVNLIGGKIWNNIKLEKPDFKTVENFPLKNYAPVQCIKIKVDGNYLVNNVLWI